MAMKFKKGASVRQVVHVIEGEVIGMQIVDDDIQFEVSYMGPDGVKHSRFFKEDEIEATPE